jgi:hypothetical protein
MTSDHSVPLIVVEPELPLTAAELKAPRAQLRRSQDDGASVAGMIGNNAPTSPILKYNRIALEAAGADLRPIPSFPP